GVLRFANPLAEQMFGRAVGELRGEPFGFPVVAGETTELDIVRRDGKAVVAELRTSRTTFDGAAARLVSLRDITDRRKAEERARKLAAEQAARAIAEAAERRSRFLAEASSILSSSLDYRVTLSS